MTGPYAAVARRYHAAGWSPIPLPHRRKKEPLAGWTGRVAPMASAADVEAWCEEHPDGNIGVRVPPWVVGIDGDPYTSEAAAGWEKLVAECGELPADAPWSTARDDGVSGIRWLSIPAGTELAGELPYGCGQVIQHHHRYIVAPPSIHPDTGKPYRWMGERQWIPDARKLPPLPQAWLDRLRVSNGDGKASDYSRPDIASLITNGATVGTQDRQLRDLVWDLMAAGLPKPAIYAVWQTTVRQTVQTKPEPWTAADFERHWEGADRKLSPAAASPLFQQPGEPASPNGHRPAPEDDELAALAEIAADFTPVDWHAAWDAKPEEIQWLIEPLIEAGQSVALFATPGVGKSLIALELAAALATGRPVLGNPKRDPVTVVYIDVENRQPSLVERLQAFRYEPASLGRLILFSFPSIAALDSLLGGQQILALAVTHRAAIVIIDTTSRVVAGKENEADTYLAFYRHTVIPLRARGIALLRLDHPGKDVARGTRGSSAKKGDVDAEWLLSKTSELTLSLDRQKERDNHGDPHLGLRRHFEPLRHEVTAGSGDRAGELAAELDRLNVPPDVGRVIAGKALRDAGIKVRGTDLAAALRRRKTIPWQPTFTAAQSDSQSAGTAGNRPPRSDPAGTGSHPQHSGGNREPSPVPSGGEER